MNTSTFSLIISFLLSNLFIITHSKLIGAAILPHGDFALDPYLLDDISESMKLKVASLEIASEIQKLKPDLIFLSTPHGYELKNDFLIYLNSNLSGFYIMGSDLHDKECKKCYNLTMSVKSNLKIASDLVDYLAEKGNQIEGLQGFLDNYPLDFSWAELIPLSFLDIAYKQFNHTLPEVLFFGQPTKRIDKSVEMIPDLLKVGGDLAEYFESLDKRVYVIISSDLAHTFRADGPYGYCECAQPFDDSIRNYASTLNKKYLLKDAAHYQKVGAKSCGFTGIVMLEGMIEKLGKSNFSSEVLAISHPTYFGMMSAKLNRN